MGTVTSAQQTKAITFAQQMRIVTFAQCAATCNNKKLGAATNSNRKLSNNEQ
jgi:hypothetical protein